MALESATYIGDLVTTNPAATDLVGQGDDHTRLIKQVLQNTFPNMSSVFRNTVRVDTSYSITANANYTLFLNAGTTTLTTTFVLPPSASITAGWSITLFPFASGNVVTKPVGADTINGTTAVTAHTDTALNVIYLGLGGFLAYSTPNALAGVAIYDGALDVRGGQIKFPATQVASSDANTLDDYEEGTWTPAISFATPGNQSIVYSTQQGNYTKIGRLVTLSFVLATTTFTHTTAAGQLFFSTFPFAAGSQPLAVLAPQAFTGFRIGAGNGGSQVGVNLFGVGDTRAGLSQIWYPDAADSSTVNINTSSHTTGSNIVFSGSFTYTSA